MFAIFREERPHKTKRTFHMHTGIKGYVQNLQKQKLYDRMLFPKSLYVPIQTELVELNADKSMKGVVTKEELLERYNLVYRSPENLVAWSSSTEAGNHFHNIEYESPHIY